MKKTNTAEKYYKSSFILFAVTTVAICSITAVAAIIFYAIGDNGSPFLICTAAFCLIMLPLAIYYLTQFIYYKNVTLSQIQQVKMEKTDTSYLRSIGFTLTVDHNGKKITVKTKHVFSAGIIGANTIDDYSGKLAEIGYDEKRDEWIVLVL